jgi:murein DD-endopeptidase MepM/ murein hydrolase activator NlpD
MRLGWLVVAISVAGCDHATETTVAKAPEAPMAAAVVASPAVVWQRSQDAIGRGEPLDLVLSRMGVAPAERFAVAEAFAEEVDLRRILPGETVEIARDDEGRIREAILQRDRLNSVVAKLDDGARTEVHAERRETDRCLRRLDGTLDGSLYESVIASGGDSNVVMRFADLLGWQVDFLTEPREGDRFRMLVEEEILDGEFLGFGRILAAEYNGDRASARAVRYEDEEGVLDWYDDDGKSVRRAFLKSPLDYRRISSRFTGSRRHPILKTVRPHWGVDYAAPTGTPVSALGSGIVEFRGRKGGFGNYIEIRHSSTYTTCYGHLSRFSKGLARGARVEQGEVIGYVGSTGLSTGPHLDFRVRKNGNYVDPLKLDAPPGRTVPGSESTRFARHRDRLWQLTRTLDSGESVPADVAWAEFGAGGESALGLALAP